MLELLNAINSFSNLGPTVPKVPRSICCILFLITSLIPAYALCFCVPQMFELLLLISFWPAGRWHFQIHMWQFPLILLHTILDASFHKRIMGWWSSQGWLMSFLKPTDVIPLTWIGGMWVWAVSVQLKHLPVFFTRVLVNPVERRETFFSPPHTEAFGVSEVTVYLSSEE